MLRPEESCLLLQRLDRTRLLGLRSTDIELLQWKSAVVAQPLRMRGTERVLLPRQPVNPARRLRVQRPAGVLVPEQPADRPDRIGRPAEPAVDRLD